MGVMGWLTARVGAKWASRIVCAVLSVLVIGLTCLVAYCTGHHDGKQGEVVGEQARTIQTQQQQAAAHDRAADQRVRDAVRSAQQQQELDNAISNSSGDLARQHRGCVILRQQGRDTSDLAACR